MKGATALCAWRPGPSGRRGWWGVSRCAKGGMRRFFSAIAFLAAGTRCDYTSF